jgi:4-aminobutyrate aminotransferase-like enzyme
VCHVGHCHPRVVEAASKQLAVLNTNSRYLHPAIVEYSKRLLAKFPAPLADGCIYFCNSGSEANDLAVRIARAHTGSFDVLCLNHAYHGHVVSAIGFSPYKFELPGGGGQPEWSHQVPIPDPYRGIHRGDVDDPEVGAAYGKEALRVVEEAEGKGRKVAAFIAESMVSCGGQIVLPQGFLKGTYEAVRSHGGVCIADEVQVGFGRVGTHWWAFETQGVVPDIVTIGKPMGNGFPIAAVVVRAELARSFSRGMSHFNTYAGGPVAAQVGLAVLDVIEEERLMERALATGAALLEGFRLVARDHPEAGDARGLGLFVGLEVVKPLDFAAQAAKHGVGETDALDGEMLAEKERETFYKGKGVPPPAPWGALCEAVAERMKERGILLAVDGPWGNVLKMKPPMCFSLEDAKRTIAELYASFKELKPVVYKQACSRDTTSDVPSLADAVAELSFA